MQSALKPTSPDAANKLSGLEALRFLTAFAVLVFHYRHFAFVADKVVGLVPERLPLYGWLHAFHDFGVYGVWIFWCISGFIFFFGSTPRRNRRAVRQRMEVLSRFASRA